MKIERFKQTQQNELEQSREQSTRESMHRLTSSSGAAKTPSHGTSSDEQTTSDPQRPQNQIDFLVQRKWFIVAHECDIRQRYEFLERIGAGAFGSVYKVRDPLSGKANSVLQLYSFVSCLLILDLKVVYFWSKLP